MSPMPVDADDLDPSDDEITARDTLAQSFETFSIYPGHDHFLGKSSSLMFLQTAIDMKQEYVSPPREGQDEGPERERPVLLGIKRPEFWNEHTVSGLLLYLSRLSLT